MPGKILIVDGLPTNRIVLKVKLATAFYEVAQAGTGTDALAVIAGTQPDLILVGEHLSDMDGCELCRRIKANAATAHIPLVMITAAASPGLRHAALAAGADDLLSKPLEDLVLLARIRSLLRARDAEQELALRDGTDRALGFAEEAEGFAPAVRIGLVSHDRALAANWARQLRETMPHYVNLLGPRDILGVAAPGRATPVPDVFVIALNSNDPEQSLTLLTDIRTRRETRHAGIVFVVSPANRRAAARALDLGANDLMSSGFDAEELALRLSRQITRKRMADRQRRYLHQGLRAAVTDPLTGLYNRRYALPHLASIAQNATGRSFAVMVADLDHFKLINDNYGHAAGDAVLVEVSRRIHVNLRAIDLVARIGGEEFLVVMPDTAAASARIAARRLCKIVAQTPVVIPDRGLTIPVTISIGVAIGGALTECRDVSQLLDRADRTLYAAKADGRNKVLLERPAA